MHRFSSFCAVWNVLLSITQLCSVPSRKRGEDSCKTQEVNIFHFWESWNFQTQKSSSPPDSGNKLLREKFTSQVAERRILDSLSCLQVIHTAPGFSLCYTSSMLVQTFQWWRHFWFTPDPGSNQLLFFLWAISINSLFNKLGLMIWLFFSGISKCVQCLSRKGLI